MSQTLLRFGLWMVLLALVGYVLRETLSDPGITELLNDTILQRVGGFGLLLIAGAGVASVLEKAAGKVGGSRCVKCRQKTFAGEIYCRTHLREVLDVQDNISRRSRLR